MRRIGAIALVLWAGLAFGPEAQAKPKHQPLKCKAGYGRRAVWVPKRIDGRVVRRHGRIVRVKVRRCVKDADAEAVVSRSAPGRHPHQSDDIAASGDPDRPGHHDHHHNHRHHDHHTTASASASASASPPPVTGDPVVVAVGDIARPPDCAPDCEQSATAALAQTFNPAAVLVLGDNQYEEPHEGIDSYSDYMGSYDLTWGRDFNSIVHPVPGNHEYLGSDAAGYFAYFGGSASRPTRRTATTHSTSAVGTSSRSTPIAPTKGARMRSTEEHIGPNGVAPV